MTATSDPGTVRTERIGRGGAIARLSLDRPGALNSLTPEMVSSLRAAVADADADPSVSAILLDGGTSPSFCAGANLQSTTDDELLEPLPDSPYLSAKPTVAAVRGWAVGVGFKLACAADLIVADDTAVFWAPETRVGVLGTGDLAHRLVRQLPYRVAMELLLVGTKLPAVGAYQRGLVNSVVPGRLLDRRAEELVERLTTVNSFVDIVRDRR